MEMRWHTGRRTIELNGRALVMGILNVTPDSFSDGGRHVTVAAAMESARRMIGEGADLIDIGGESTRPGAEPVAEDEEIRRVVPVVEALRAEWDGVISIDTMKPGVAREALRAGAEVVNDVSGLRDEAMVTVCRDAGCGVVAMHMQGEPRTMQVAPAYEDVVAEVRGFFEERLETLRWAGISPEAVCLDPGIGFGKTLEHNLALLRGLGQLGAGGRPVMVGLSRKRFLGVLAESERMEDREWPTVALTAWTREQGAMIHRVHRVKENREALRMVEAVLGVS